MGLYIRSKKKRDFMKTWKNVFIGYPQPNHLVVKVPLLIVAIIAVAAAHYVTFFPNF
jgi:hypothetical protein